LRKKRAELTRALDNSFSADDARLLEIQLGVIDSVEQQLCAVEAVLEERVVEYNEILERLDTVPGINRTLAIDLLAEIGTDMSAWPSERHFAAWTGTAPGNRESAGVRRRARSREGDPYVKSVLVQAASSASRVIGSYLSSRYRRLAARRGERRALLAIAHELAISIYYMLVRQENYRPPLSAQPEVIREQRRRRLIREFAKLGYEVSCSPIA
jgi:transposase